MRYNYLAFGLTIQSDLYFPELPPLEAAVEHPDIRIQYTQNLTTGLKNPLSSMPRWQARENALWLNVTNVAKFLITEGRFIGIEPYPKSDPASVRLFILGSCMGALLMQRNYFVLHGNAIQVGQSCISIVGDSGAGKSTLCGAFFKKGYSILADDVCAINSTLQVSPSFPQIKLWKDSATFLNINTDNLRKIRPNDEKFAVPLNTQYQSQALPIRVIYQLKPSNAPLQKQEISGLKKLSILYNNTYRKQYLKGLNKTLLHHTQAANLARKVSVIELSRPQAAFQLDAIVHLIENDLSKKGLL